MIAALFDRRGNAGKTTFPLRLTGQCAGKERPAPPIELGAPGAAFEGQQHTRERQPQVFDVANLTREMLHREATELLSHEFPASRGVPS